MPGDWVICGSEGKFTVEALFQIIGTQTWRGGTKALNICLTSTAPGSFQLHMKMWPAPVAQPHFTGGDKDAASIAVYGSSIKLTYHTGGNPQLVSLMEKIQAAGACG